jgi:hypothetical protein
VAALNLVAMTVYCWHQTALLLVTFAGLAAGQPAGLLDAPGAGWPWHRLLWLPAFATTLTLLVVLFRRFEPHHHRRQAPRASRPAPAAADHQPAPAAADRQAVAAHQAAPARQAVAARRR